MNTSVKLNALRKTGPCSYRLVTRLAHSDSSVTLRSDEHQRYTRVAEMDPDAEFSPTHSPAARAVARANRIHLSLSHRPGVELGDLEVAQLMNGMMVASVPTEFPAYHVQLAVKAGPRFEEPWSLGVSHVVRRMFGLASKPFRFAVNQNRTLQQLGASVECKGSREMTLYQLSQYKFNDEAIDVAATAFAYASTMPALYPWEISRNMGMLRLDLADLRGGTALLLERLHSVAFRSGLANSLWCPEHRMAEISADTVEQYWQQYYTPDRFALVGVGLPIGTLKDMAHKFCFLEPKQPKAQPSRWLGGESRTENGNPCVQIAIGFPGASAADAGKSAAQTVLAALLADCLDSDAANGPATVTPLNLQYSDAGIFGLHIVCNYQDAGSVVKATMSKLKELTQSGFNEASVSAAKRSAARASAESQLQPNSRLQEISSHLLLGSAASQCDSVANVTPQQATEQLKACCLVGSSGWQQPAIASIGRLDSVPFRDEIGLD